MGRIVVLDYNNVGNTMILISTMLTALTITTGSVYEDTRPQHDSGVYYAYDPQFYDLDR